MNELDLNGLHYRPEGVRVFVDETGGDGRTCRVEIYQETTVETPGTVLELGILLSEILTAGSTAVVMVKQRVRLTGSGAFSGVRITPLKSMRVLKVDIEQTVPLIDENQEWCNVRLESLRATNGYGEINVKGDIGVIRGNLISRKYERFA